MNAATKTMATILSTENIRANPDEICKNAASPRAKGAPAPGASGYERGDCD